MDYKTYQNLRAYCWQDLSVYIDTPFNNETRELKRFMGGKSVDIEHEHAAAMGLFQCEDLTPRERAAAHLLAVISNHRAIAWHREPVTPDGRTPAAPLEPWQVVELQAQTSKAIEKYAAFVPEREAVQLLALIQDTAPAQTPATTALVVAVETASDEPKPLPLTTLDIAHCFDGLYWNESKWKTNLGKRGKNPGWLGEDSIAIPGKQGGNEIRWNPVRIGAALFAKQGVKPHSIRARFRTNRLLAEWLDEWNNYESQYLTTE